MRRDRNDGQPEPCSGEVARCGCLLLSCRPDTSFPSLRQERCVLHGWTNLNGKSCRILRSRFLPFDTAIRLIRNGAVGLQSTVRNTDRAVQDIFRRFHAVILRACEVRCRRAGDNRFRIATVDGRRGCPQRGDGYRTARPGRPGGTCRRGTFDIPLRRDANVQVSVMGQVSRERLRASRQTAHR